VRRLTTDFITSAKEVMFSSLFVCLLATLRKNVRTDLHEIFRKGWQWTSEEMIKFWWRSGSSFWIQALFSGFLTNGKYGKWFCCCIRFLQRAALQALY